MPAIVKIPETVSEYQAIVTYLQSDIKPNNFLHAVIFSSFFILHLINDRSLANTNFLAYKANQKFR
jgi:hypothetical protein